MKSCTVVIQGDDIMLHPTDVKYFCYAKHADTAQLEIFLYLLINLFHDK